MTETTASLALQTMTYLDQREHVVRDERNLHHEASDSWPCEAELPWTECLASDVGPGGGSVLVHMGEGIANVHLGDGFARVRAFAPTRRWAAEALEQVRSELPRSEPSGADEVPVTFWSDSPNGPQSQRRMIDAPAFEEIEDNYPHAGELLSLIHDWKPGTGGQLLLWHGEPGTGKTTALRSLGREWADWAELHYIVDPDRFFGAGASYLMSVMTGGSFDEERPFWRVLVLEDCGEMLAMDARRDVGQALSRLLNACDGLIGRGLRVIVLMTTNEPLEKVHPAINRPGRCAARVEFVRFAPLLAADWLRGRGHLLEHALAGAVTLADLYAMRDGLRHDEPRAPAGFSA